MTAPGGSAAPGSAPPGSAAATASTAAPVAGEDTAWSTWYVYLHRPAAEQDRFLLDVAAPLLRSMVTQGRASGWHFLRYWAGGPHLRLRLRDVSPADVALVTADLRAAAARPVQHARVDAEVFYAQFRGPGAEHWHDDGEVVLAPYLPETDRYGGPRAMRRCEELFGLSSQIAVDVLAAARSAQDVRLVAIDFLLLMLDRIATGATDAMVSARRYFAAWDFSPEAVTDAATARRAAETMYWAAPQAWDRRPRAVAEVAAQGGPTTHAAWARALDDVVADLRAIEADGELVTGVDRILWSLMHMMSNRLGLGVAEERAATWLASLCLPGWERPGFFDDGVRAPDRSYLEGSKYRRDGIETEQRPRTLAAPPQPYPAVFVPVPSGATPVLTMPLGEALVARESGYGDYGGHLELARLGGLLGAAAGLAPGRRRTFGDRTVRYRTYPSASGATVVDLWVIARAVDGLTPGAYRYDADRHGFERVDTRTDEDTLPALSPMFGRVGTGAALIEADRVPAVVVLVAHLDRLRVKYGLRALRLALLEAGHVAQNLGLVAAATGLRSVHLQAFVDDEVCSRLHLDGYTRVPVAVLPVGERRVPGLPYDDPTPMSSTTPVVAGAVSGADAAGTEERTHDE